MENFPGWTSSFELLHRQETSRTANGVTLVKDFGRPIWRASWVSRSLKPNELDFWRARIDALGYGLETFQASPSSRCFPQAHPNGRGLAAGAITVATIGSDNSSLTLEGPGAVGLTLTQGDVLSAGGKLYRVTGRTAGTIRVRPYFWPGLAVGAVVTVRSPSVAMRIDPGSVSSSSGLNGRGVISFSATEAV